MSTKRAEPRRGGATSADGTRKAAEPRPDTRRRIRKIVARHRVSLDYLAEK